MRRIYSLLLACLIVALSYLFLWPVEVEPAFASLPPAMPLTGALQVNDALHSCERIGEDVGTGPEDVALVSDTALYAEGIPTLCIGLRGLCYMEVEATGPARDLHSGLYGGAAPNAIEAIAQIIAQIKGTDGKIRIPGFYDSVESPAPEELAAWRSLPFNEEEYRQREVGSPELTGEAGFSVLERTWARPTLEVHGIVGGFVSKGFKTVIPAKAHAKISCRLVPSQDPEITLNQLKAAIAAATSQTELARVTFRRMQELRASKSITEQEFDEAQARLRMAESQIQMAQARKFQTRERIRQADEAVNRAQLQQNYATVTAPFAGLVLERKAEPGTFASPGMPIAIIERAGDYRLEVPVEESLLKSLKPGQKVTVEMDTVQELPIAEILPALNAQSRTATIRINLPSRAGLRTGMSGRIRLPGEERDAVTIPQSAIRANGQLQTVFIVTGNRARANECIDLVFLE